MRETLKIRKLFYFAIILILVVLSANGLMMREFMHNQDHVAGMIDISGRQRMLSQSAAMWSEMLVDAETIVERTQARREILRIADEMMKAHSLLTDPENHIGKVTRSTRKLYDIYYSEPNMLDSQVRQFVQRLQHITEVPDVALNEDMDDRQYILNQSSGRLITAFEEAVSAYKQRNDEDFAILNVVSALFTASIVAGVVVMWFYIFKPMLFSVTEALKLTRLQQEVATAANESVSIEQGMKAGIEAICRHTGWQIGHAYVYSEDKSALINLDAWHIANDIREYEDFIKLSADMSFGNGEGFIGEVYKDAVPMWIMSLTDSPVYLRKDQILKTGMTSVYAFPVYVGRKVKAVLEFYTNDAQMLDEALFQLMKNLGNQLGQVIERAQFQERAKLLETVISSANDGIIITNASTEKPGPKIVYVNEAFSRITGYTHDEVIGKSPRMLQGEGTSSDVLRNIYGELKQGKSYKGEILNIDRLGNPYWMEISIVPVRDNEGRITNFAAIERDITERKTAERNLENVVKQLKRANMLAEASARDLKESLDKAEEASKAKSDFLANMSHELRTPMNGVLGMAHLLEDTMLDDDQRQLVSTINGSAENLLMLLNDILDFSKIEAGALDLETIAYDMRDMVEKTLYMLRPQAARKSIDLLLEFDRYVPTYLWGDPGRVRQIITNLTSNAIKFTNYGHVRVRLSEVENFGDKKLCITVEDTGMGIPANKLNEIFDKFTQGDASVTRKYGGTGLGLAITKQLVLLMGGEIGVESVEGRGSTFWILLPMKPAAQEDAISKNEHLSIANQATSMLKPIGDVRALLVEDYPVNQVFAEKLLRKFGFTRIDVVENGLDALKSYRTNHYDIIFMDCQMPELDGYQTTQKIRLIEDDTPIHTPIIAMTANAMMGDREKCLKSGMDDYLSKPLRAEHLKKVLSAWFVMDADKAILSNKVAPSISQKVGSVDIEQLRLFTDGDPEEEKELIQLFLEQAQEMVTLMEKSAGTQDNELWKSAAHRFKGSSGNLGAMQLHHLCKRAEHQFEESADNKTMMLSAIKQEILNVREFFDLLDSKACQQAG